MAFAYMHIFCRSELIFGNYNNVTLISSDCDCFVMASTVQEQEQ